MKFRPDPAIRPALIPDGYRWDSPPKLWFAADSLLEEDGFELSVPRDTTKLSAAAYTHEGTESSQDREPCAASCVLVRRQESRADLPYTLIGHSAGAQFLSRVAAFAEDEATHTVIANPSTWVRPTLDVAAPYGFKGVYGPAQGDAALRRYLAASVTVLLGREDVGSRDLAT